MPTDPQSENNAASLRRWLSRASVLVGWCAAVALLLGLALARLVDGAPAPVSLLALLVQTFAFHAGLAVAGLLLTAVVVRKWKLGAVLLLGVLVTVGPVGLRAMRSATPPIDDDRTLTVLSCNLRFGSADADALIAWIGQVDPDVILLQEYDQSWSDVVSQRLKQRYPHIVEDPQHHAFGSATLSRLPFVESTMLTWSGQPDVHMPRTTISHEGRLVDVVNVHAVPPVALSWVRRQMSQIADLAEVGSGRLGAVSRPDSVDAVLLVGDFNAPWNTNHLRPLAGSGFWEAHARVGTNRGATWGPTSGLLSLAPGIRLDHAVYGGGLEPVFSVVGPDVGSDHLPIAVGLRWRATE